MEQNRKDEGGKKTGKELLVGKLAPQSSFPLVLHRHERMQIGSWYVRSKSPHSDGHGGETVNNGEELN